VFDARLRVLRTPLEETVTKDGRAILVGSFVLWRVGAAGTFLEKLGELDFERARYPEARERAVRLERLVAGLPDVPRTVVTLYYYQDRSVAEVARILQMPENTVKTRLFYARKRLAALARNAGIDREWL